MATVKVLVSSKQIGSHFPKTPPNSTKLSLKYTPINKKLQTFQEKAAMMTWTNMNLLAAMKHEIHIRFLA